MVSGQHAFSEGMHGFEEIARWPLAIGERDVDLEVRLTTAHGQPLDRQSGTLGLRQQDVGTGECRSARMMHYHAPGDFGSAQRPVQRHTGERVATGPASGVERFQLDVRGPAQHTAYNERIAAATDAANRPHPGNIAWLKEDDQSHAGEWGLAVADHHLDGGRAQPAYGGALAKGRQAILLSLI